MPQTRNCPFSSADDRTCERSDCRLWITYVTAQETSGTGECCLKLLAIMGLPNFGGALEPDVD